MARETAIPRAIFASALSALRLMQFLSDKRWGLGRLRRAEKLNHPGEDAVISEAFSCR